MPKVIRVEKSRKSPGACGKCGAVIETGQPYVYWEPYMQSKRVRCTKPGCYPRPSETVGSEYLSTLYAAQETLEDAIGGFESTEDLAQALRDAAEAVRELGSETQEKFDNMPEGLQQGETGTMLEERAGACEALADELDCAADEVEGVEFPNVDPEPVKAEAETDEDFVVRREQWYAQLRNWVEQEHSARGEEENDQRFNDRAYDSWRADVDDAMEAAREHANGVDFSQAEV